MTKNDLVSLLKSRSPLDYPILTPLVSFISLGASFEAGLIHSLETLTLTNINHVSIMKSSVCPIPKRGGITGQSDLNMLAYIGTNHTRSLYGSIGSKTRIYKESIPRMRDSLIS